MILKRTRSLVYSFRHDYNCYMGNRYTNLWHDLAGQVQNEAGHCRCSKILSHALSRTKTQSILLGDCKHNTQGIVALNLSIFVNKFSVLSSLGCNINFIFLSQTPAKAFTLQT